MATVDGPVAARVDFRPGGPDGDDVFDVFSREAAGRSAERKHKELTRAWQVRMFGRRARLYAVTSFTLVLILVINLHLNGRWSLVAGLTIGMAIMGTWLVPDTLVPSHISNWQLGAWGEQMTASELKALRRDGWLVRHDVKWGPHSNHDHVLVGGAIYVLNSKNLKDSEMSIENGGIRVTRIESPEDGYFADRWCPMVKNEASSLKWKLGRTLPFPVHVYPVIVLWGTFDEGQTYVGDVSVVRGDKLVEWIRSRPHDVRDPVKKRQVADAVRALPSA
jgi:hypothetical protein